jgi:hypothetical protein
MFLLLRSVFVFLCCAGVLALGVAVQAESVAEIAARCSPSVVQIIMYDAAENKLSMGSGFLVAPGLVATCYHVIDGGVSAQVKTVEKVSYPVDAVVAYDREHDLAILSVKHLKDIPALTLGDLSLSKPGEPVVALGSPLGLEGSAVTDGVVSAIRTLPLQGEVVQVSCPISSGNSGGPVVNGKGEVIGVIASMLRGGQNVNFGISVASLQELLHKPLPKEIDLTTFQQQQHKEELTNYGILPACPATMTLTVPKAAPYTLAPFLQLRFFPESVRVTSIVKTRSSEDFMAKAKTSVVTLQRVDSENDLGAGKFFLTQTGVLKFAKEQGGWDVVIAFSYRPIRVAIWAVADDYSPIGAEALEVALHRIGFETVRGAEVDAAVAASRDDEKKLAKSLDCAYLTVVSFQCSYDRRWVKDAIHVININLSTGKKMLDSSLTGEWFLKYNRKGIKDARIDYLRSILGGIEVVREK